MKSHFARYLKSKQHRFLSIRTILLFYGNVDVVRIQACISQWSWGFHLFIESFILKASQHCICQSTSTQMLLKLQSNTIFKYFCTRKIIWSNPTKKLHDLYRLKTKCPIHLHVFDLSTHEIADFKTIIFQNNSFIMSVIVNFWKKAFISLYVGTKVLAVYIKAFDV